MSVHWEDALSLEDEEYVVASWTGELVKNPKNSFPSSEEIFPSSDEIWGAMGSVLVLTNHRLVFMHGEDVEGIPFAAFIRGHEFSIPLQSIKVLTISWGGVKMRTAEDEYFAILPGLGVPTEEEAKYFKEKVLGQIKERRRELEAKKTPVLIDFSFLKTYIEKGGIVLTTLKCPHCGAPIKMPKDGTETVCEHCGSTVYAQDIFETVKKLME